MSVKSNGGNLDREGEHGTTLFGSEQKQWQWSKIPGESCKIPNSKLLSLYAGPDGTLASRFSPNGLLLAVAQHSQVSVFSIPHGALVYYYNAHTGLIYSITWYEDSKRFLTASSDRTVCVWDLTQGRDPVWILPHPCYVYDALFLECSIITCCYDGILRVWNCVSTSGTADLTDELNGHKGYVNAICYNPVSGCLFSGDSRGVVIVWRLNEKTKRWCQARTLLINGLQDIVINSLIIYGRSCLIVHSQDSVLRMIDATSGVVLQWYKVRKIIDFLLEQ
uniref:Jouberin n=3 Tax=Cacopsylla melanoneura TaxID=428564 RepID=A0A8D9B1T0_9HEMI